MNRVRVVSAFGGGIRGGSLGTKRKLKSSLKGSCNCCAVAATGKANAVPTAAKIGAQRKLEHRSLPVTMP